MILQKFVQIDRGDKERQRKYLHENDMIWTKVVKCPKSSNIYLENCRKSVDFFGKYVIMNVYLTELRKDGFCETFGLCKVLLRYYNEKV